MVEALQLVVPAVEVALRLVAAVDLHHGVVVALVAVAAVVGRRVHPLKLLVRWRCVGGR